MRDVDKLRHPISDSSPNGHSRIPVARHSLCDNRQAGQREGGVVDSWTAEAIRVAYSPICLWVSVLQIRNWCACWIFTRRTLCVHSGKKGKGKGKGKVDNLYRSSKRIRSLQNRYYNYPLVHWTHAIGCHIQAHWHENPRKVPTYTAWWTEAHWCEQLAQGRCPTMQRLGVEPATSRSR